MYIKKTAKTKNIHTKHGFNIKKPILYNNFKYLITNYHKNLLNDKKSIEKIHLVLSVIRLVVIEDSFRLQKLQSDIITRTSYKFCYFIYSLY